MSTSRFPLVLDNTDGSRIIELPAGDSLNLENSDLVGVKNIAVEGGLITIDGVPLSTFSGFYADLINKPFIPTRLVELGIIDGDNGEVLYANGDGTYEFKPLDFDYNSLTGVPAIPATLTDLGVVDGTAGNVLTTDGAGNFTFIDLNQDLFGNFDFIDSTLTTVNPGVLTITPNSNYLKIDNTQGMVLPVGTDAQRALISEIGAIRFNSDHNVFEGMYQGYQWNTLGDIRSVDGLTFITPEAAPGVGDNNLQFFTNDVERLHINTTEAVFDPSITVTVGDLNVANMNLTGGITLAGDVIIGDGIEDTLNINAKVASSFVPTENNAFNVGSTLARWQDFYTQGQLYINNYTLAREDGQENNILKTNGKGVAEFTSADTFGGNRVYVSEQYGSDFNNGVDAPVRTIKRATEIASKMIAKPANIDTQFELESELWLANDLIANTIQNVITTHPGHSINVSVLQSDLKLILDAIVIDQANTNSYLSGLVGSYFARRIIPFCSNSATDQNVAFDTLDTAIIQSPISTNRNLFAQSVAIVKDIVANGITARPGYMIDASASQEAFSTLIDFIVSEFDNHLTVNNMTIVYLRTEIQYVFKTALEAIYYDLVYGGTAAQNTALKMFQQTVLEQFPTTSLAVINSLNYIQSVIQNILRGVAITPSAGNIVPQDTSVNADENTISNVVAGFDYLIQVLQSGELPINILPQLTTIIQKTDANILNKQLYSYYIQITDAVESAANNKNGISLEKDIRLLIDSILFDGRRSSNDKTVWTTNYFAQQKSNSVDITPIQTAITFLRGAAINSYTGAHLTTVTGLLDIIDQNLALDTPTPAVIDGLSLFQRVGIIVATGNYVEDNPFILPEYVTLLGEDGVIIRPKNPEYDIIKARDNSNIINITFKDYVDGSQTPVSSWKYAVAIDNISEMYDRRSYIGMPLGVTTTFSPITIQNCVIISVLGGNGLEVDGTLVDALDMPPLSYGESDPESSYIALMNNVFIKSFGGTGVRSTNNAQVKCIDTRIEFAETGFISQSGGLLELTNCSTSYGYFNLQATGYTTEVLATDIGVFTNYGEIEGKQSLKITNLDRPLNPHYVLQVVDQANDDVTNEYENNDLNLITNTFTVSNSSVTNSSITFPSNHGLSDGDLVQYDSQGTSEIKGLKNEVTYYAKVQSATDIALFYNKDLTQPVLDMNYTSADGNEQRFLTNFEKIYVHEVIYNSNRFQEIQLDNTLTYPLIIVGNTIYGETAPGSGEQIIGAIAAWNETTTTLLVGLEPASDGVIREFSVGSVIDEGVVASPSTAQIPIIDVENRDDKWSSHFTINTSLDNQIRAIGNTVAKTGRFYRPSIINSQNHKWEFPGSGVDYTALPAHGGNLNRDAEAVQTLPGRVYVQGSNESGDFRIGNLIEAVSKAETIAFNSKLKIQNLEILGFDKSNSQPVTFISTDKGLGHNEANGPSDERLVTQAAVHSYIDDNLETVMNRQVSDVPITRAIAQLNNRGEIDYQLLPEKSTYTVHLLNNYRERFEMHLIGSPINLQAGDIVAEEYNQVILTLSAPVSLSRGEQLQQANTNAVGYVKDDVVNSPTVFVIQPITGTFSQEIADVISTNLQGPLVDPTTVIGVYATEVYGEFVQRDNYIINTALESQYLVVEGSDVNGITSTPSFTVKIANGETVTSVNSQATGTPTSFVLGCLALLDADSLPLAANYQDGEYSNVELVTATGLGYGALADVTISAGAITALLVKRSGEGYNLASELRLADDPSDLSVAGANYVTRFGGTQPTLSPYKVENRLYVDIDATKERHFVATPGNPDYIEDDSSIEIQLTDLANVDTYDFYGYPIDPTLGGVDTVNSYITFENDHIFDNGDYVQYSNNGFPTIGGLTHNQTYYVKTINSNTIELYYTNGLHSNEKVYFTESQYGNHRLIVNAAHVRSNQFYLPDHGLGTGDAIKFVAANSPDTINSEDFFFIGSVTQNTFTLHEDFNNSLQSINGNTVRPVNFTDAGAGLASFFRMPTRIVEAVNTSGRAESSWTEMWRTEIDGTDVITGIVPAQRLGRYTANTNTFLRGDNTWRNAVERVYTSMPNIIKFDSNSEILGSDSYHFSDVKVDIAYASYDSPAMPVLGEETPGVASFNFNHFNIQSPGHITTKPSTEGGQIDAMYLDGEDGVYWRDPSNHSRPVPVEKGGTNLASLTRGDLLYAGDDLGDGTFTQSLSTLSVGNDYDIMVSFNGLPQWSSNLVLNGLTVRNLLLAVTDDNTISTTTGNLILDSFAGTINVNDNIVVVGTEHSIDGNITIVGNTTQTGNITATGYVDSGEISIGVTFDNLIESKTKDLKLDSRTGLTIIDDNVNIIGSTDISDSLTVTNNATINQDVTIGSDLSVGETLSVGNNATVNDIQIGVSQANEIDTIVGDLVLDSNTGLTLINDDVRITGNVQLDGTLTSLGDGIFNGTQTMNGNVDINGTATVTGDLTVSGNASFEAIRAGVAGPSEIDTTSGNLILDSFTGTVEVDDNLVVNETVTVTGTTALNNDLTIIANTAITGDIVQTGNVDITGSTVVNGSSTIDEIQIGVNGTNEIDTSANDLILDSFTGETIIDDNLTVSGNLTVQGTMTSVNTTNVEITDVNILLAQGSGSALNANGAGLTVDIGASAPTIATPTLLYVASTDTWDFNKTLKVGANNFETTGTVVTNNLTSSTATITTINSSNIVNGNTITSVGNINSDTGFTTAGTISATNTISSDTGFTTPNNIVAQGTITATNGFIGNADTASKWFTPRTVTFQDSLVDVADVTGSFIIDGSADISQVALKLNADSVEDIVGNLITNSVHDGLVVLYDDNLGTLNFNVDSATLIASTGGMFDGNTETGVISTFNTTTNKIDFTLDNNVFQDLAGALFVDNTGNTGVTTAYDDANNNVVFSLIEDDIKDVIGAMATPGVQEGITVTYDSTNKVFDYTVRDTVISLAGDVSGSATMTALGDVEITTALSIVAVDLGVNTTGDYVQSLVQGDGIRIINQTGASSTPTIEHANTSSVVSTNNVSSSANTDIIYNLGFDTFGHVNHVETTNILLFEDYGWNIAINGTTEDNFKEQSIFNVVAGDNVTLAYDATTSALTITTLDTIYEGWNLYVDDVARGLITTQINVNHKAGNNVSLSYNATNNTITYNSSYKDTDTRITGVSFDTSTGVLSFTRERYDDTSGTNATTALAALTVNLDNRYTVIGNEIDTLATVTARGATTTSNVTVGTLGATDSVTITSASGTEDLNFATGARIRSSASNVNITHGTSGILIANDKNVTPLSDNDHNLGTSTVRWNTVYASVFDGVATTAQYADLAEMYLPDQDYKPGTIVDLGGTHEITQTTQTASRRIAGVISTAPAYLMNSDLPGGLPVALKGRVPVYVTGKVKKGDFIISSHIPGVGRASDIWMEAAVIGKSIEDKDTDDVQLVEVLIGVN